MEKIEQKQLEKANEFKELSLLIKNYEISQFESPERKYLINFSRNTLLALDSRREFVIFSTKSQGRDSYKVLKSGYIDEEILGHTEITSQNSTLTLYRENQALIYNKGENNLFLFRSSGRVSHVLSLKNSIFGDRVPSELQEVQEMINSCCVIRDNHNLRSISGADQLASRWYKNNATGSIAAINNKGQSIVFVNVGLKKVVKRFKPPKEDETKHLNDSSGDDNSDNGSGSELDSSLEGHEFYIISHISAPRNHLVLRYSNHKMKLVNWITSKMIDDVGLFEKDNYKTPKNEDEQEGSVGQLSSEDHFAAMMNYHISQIPKLAFSYQKSVVPIYYLKPEMKREEDGGVYPTTRYWRCLFKINLEAHKLEVLGQESSFEDKLKFFTSNGFYFSEQLEAYFYVTGGTTGLGVWGYQEGESTGFRFLGARRLKDQDEGDDGGDESPQDLSLEYEGGESFISSYVAVDRSDNLSGFCLEFVAMRAFGQLCVVKISSNN